MDQADGKSVKLSNKIMDSSWMGDPMVCIYFSWIIFFQVEFFKVNFGWNFAVNPLDCLAKFPPGKNSRWKNLHISPHFVTLYSFPPVFHLM